MAIKTKRVSGAKRATRKGATTKASGRRKSSTAAASGLVLKIGGVLGKKLKAKMPADFKGGISRFALSGVKALVE